jgi:hypothetical protein
MGVRSTGFNLYSPTVRRVHAPSRLWASPSGASPSGASPLWASTSWASPSRLGAAPTPAAESPRPGGSPRSPAGHARVRSHPRVLQMRLALAVLVVAVQVECESKL